MSDGRPNLADPRILLEAARVFNAAGPDYHSAAEVVAEEALLAMRQDEQATAGKIPPELHQAILGDCAALRLSGRVSGGYKAALELLNSVDDTKTADLEGRLHLLRALANGQKYKDLRKVEKSPSDQELPALRDKIRSDLKFAFDQDPHLRETNRRFWQTDPRDPEDDLADVFVDDGEFKKLVAVQDRQE